MKSLTYTGHTQLIHAPMNAGNLSEHGNNFNTFLFFKFSARSGTRPISYVYCQCVFFTQNEGMRVRNTAGVNLIRPRREKFHRPPCLRRT
jgi:hypothetical protein